MFKSILAFRLGADWAIPEFEDIVAQMQSKPFVPCTPTQERSSGWVPPRGAEHDAVLESVQGQWIAQLMVESKSVPSGAVTMELDRRCKAIEREYGRKPGRKERKELKEEIKLDLLPRAFAKRSSVMVWLDPENRLLVVGTTSQSAADAVIDDLAEVMSRLGSPLQVRMLHTNTSTTAAMSQWLLEDEAPAGFTIDRDLELRSMGEDKAVVRYSRHSLDIDEVKAHIEQGKVPTQLALTWGGRVSFVFTDKLSLKKVSLLDTVFEEQEDSSDFDANVALVTGELSELLPDLLEALGGEAEPKEPTLGAAAPVALTADAVKAGAVAGSGDSGLAPWEDEASPSAGAENADSAQRGASRSTAGEDASLRE